MLKRSCVVAIVITVSTFAADKKPVPLITTTLAPRNSATQKKAERAQRRRAAMKEIHQLLTIAVQKLEQLDTVTTEQFNLRDQQIKIVQADLLALTQEVAGLALKSEANRCRCNEKSQ